MSLVCGIDPSLTSAGVAILRDGVPIFEQHYGHAGKNSFSYQQRSRRIRKQVRDVVREPIERGADLVVMEEHPYAVKISGSEFDRTGLWHGIYGAFDSVGIPVVVVGNSTAKKWVTGKGNASKDDVVAAVNSWWPGITDCDDIADALGLAAIGAFHCGDPMPFPAKDRHTTGLEKIAWP